MSTGVVNLCYDQAEPSSGRQKGGSMEIDRKEFLAGLKSVGVAVSKRPGIPALSGVRVRCDRHALTLDATDLSLTARARLKGKGRRKWEAVVPLAELKRAAGVGRGSTILLDALDDGMVAVGPVELPTFDASEFPKMRDQGPVIATTTGDVFGRALLDVTKAASADDARPVLAAVQIERAKDGLRLVATNSYWLAAIGVSAAPTDGMPSRILVERSSAVAIAKHLVRSEETVEMVAASEASTLFRAGDTEWIARHVEGEFPNWRQLVPDDGGAGTLSYDLDELVDALDAVEAVGTTLATVVIRGEGGVEIQAQEDRARVRFPLEGATWHDRTGELGRIGVNREYLLPAMQLTGGAPLVIRDGLKPIVLTSGERMAMVMPVRTPTPVG